MYPLSRWLIVGLLVVTPSLGSALAPELFPTEIGAQKHCPADIVVWVNTLTGIYHFKGMRWYGNTKSGAYVCKRKVIRRAIDCQFFVATAPDWADEDCSAISPPTPIGTQRS